MENPFPWNRGHFPQGTIRQVIVPEVPGAITELPDFRTSQDTDQLFRGKENQKFADVFKEADIHDPGNESAR